MRWVFAVPALALWIPGCGGSNSKVSCGAASAQAEAPVQSAVDGSLACSTDTDCVVVTFAALCFDACTRVVNQAGVAVVKAAIAKVNAGPCATFASEGCQVESPPCAPPQPARCNAGKCTGG
jgi:hypothetical protein